jgi:hypothetical protein
VWHELKVLEMKSSFERRLLAEEPP